MIFSRIATAARLVVPVVGALIATNATAQVIVHYTADDFARAPQWALAEADLVLGAVDGDPSFVFSGLGSIQVDGSEGGASRPSPARRTVPARQTPPRPTLRSPPASPCRPRPDHPIP
jgi:hypothetical protein